MKERKKYGIGKYSFPSHAYLSSILGAKVAKNPLEVAENSDVVITMLSHPKDVREVVLGENGVLQVPPYLPLLKIYLSLS